MVSLGMFTERALSTAVRRRGLPLMSPPPSRAEMVISLMILVQTFDFLESEASFLCLILDHRLWPDIPPLLSHRRGARETPPDRLARVTNRAWRPAASGSNWPDDRRPRQAPAAPTARARPWPTRRPSRRSWR